MSEEIKNTTPNTDDQADEKINSVDELSENDLDNVAGGFQNQVSISSATGGAGAGKVSVHNISFGDGSVHK